MAIFPFFPKPSQNSTASVASRSLQSPKILRLNYHLHRHYCHHCHRCNHCHHGDPEQEEEYGSGRERSGGSADCPSGRSPTTRITTSTTIVLIIITTIAIIISVLKFMNKMHQHWRLNFWDSPIFFTESAPLLHRRNNKQTKHNGWGSMQRPYLGKPSVPSVKANKLAKTIFQPRKIGGKSV